MALRKKSAATGAQRTGDTRSRQRDRDGLLRQLHDADPGVRRWAVRDLAAYPEAVPELFQRLQVEKEHVVREAIFSTLQQVGGQEVVAGLIDLLRSEEASLRNEAIEVLQTMPNEIAPHIEKLLADPDSDVRIFAIDILQQLAHPNTPQWLASVLERDPHVNVVAAAVDRLAEVGTPEMIPALQGVKQRFAQEHYLGFAVDVVIQRIEER